MKKIISFLLIIVSLSCNKEISSTLAEQQQNELIGGKFLIKDSIGIEVGQTKDIYQFNDGRILSITLMSIDRDEPCIDPNWACFDDTFISIWFKRNQLPYDGIGGYEFGLNSSGEIDINADSTGKKHYLAFTDLIRYNLGGRVAGRIVILTPKTH